MKQAITKVVGELTTETLTKELGEKMLAGCKNERKLKERHVDFIENSIVFSGWNNSSTISMSDGGELLDGQHRLWALKKLGWPRIKIQVCTYKSKDITPSLRSSFNKAVKQSVSDTMKMCYGWDNVTRRCGICSTIYKAFLNRGHAKCDDVSTLAIDKAFGDEIAEFANTTVPHDKRRSSFNADITACFVVMRVFRGPSKAGEIQSLRKNAENRLNCDSNNCIAARINDFAKPTPDGGSRGHRGEKYLELYRVCMAIDMALNGKRVCGPIERFKDEEVNAFGDIIRPFMKKKMEEIDF